MWSALLSRDFLNYSKINKPLPSNMLCSHPKVLENVNRPMPMCVSNPSLRSFDDDDNDMTRSERVNPGCFSSSYDLYLFNYTRNLEQTYYQLASIRPLHHRLSSFIKSPASNKGDELIGCIFDLIRIDNPDIARAVSIRRQVAMKVR